MNYDIFNRSALAIIHSYPNKSKTHPRRKGHFYPQIPTTGEKAQNSAYSVFLLNSLQIKLDIMFYLALHYTEKARATI